ncbi:uncharacterized protein LOC108090329 [Drosophila ficusphila]|uniref:uncharacterized protein LOC108090329 n=1 Tax=Drosophila ficusphila TaxID=30025 RepID=UPI0007E73E56|nr:uncharacterized protein LOC108090329 [Drosophila ficusphila]
MVAAQLLTLTITAALLLGFHLARAERKWDYEPISLTTTSSDDSKLKIDAKIVRIGRGDFGLSVTIEWKYDANEETMVEAYAYRSNSGDESDYKLLPWSIPKQKFYEYIDTYYKDMIIKNMGYCSNLPKFEGKFQPPWPRDTYKLDKCKIDGEGLPDVAPPGYYKIIFTKFGPGQPTWGFTAVFKLTTKMF